MMIEYRIVPVKRFIVTRYEMTEHAGSVSERGEYGNAEIAYEVAYALCKAEHDAAGTPLDDNNFKYPEHIYSDGPQQSGCAPVTSA